MADKDENLQDTPKEELKKQIEGQVAEQAEKEADIETPAPEVTEEKQEDLILGKFKSQDDLITSYQELEKRSTKAEQTKSQYHDLMEPYVEFDGDGNVIGMKPQTPKEPEGKPQDDVWKELEDRYSRYETQYGPIGAQIRINAEMASVISQKATAPVEKLEADQQIEVQKKRVRTSKTDFPDYEDEIDKYLSKMDTKSKTNPNAVETVYYIVKGKKSEDLVKSSEQETVLKTVAIEEQKVKAQVEQQTKTPEEPKKDINSLSSKEMASHFKLKRTD